MDAASGCFTRGVCIPKQPFTTSSHGRMRGQEREEGGREKREKGRTWVFERAGEGGESREMKGREKE